LVTPVVGLPPEVSFEETGFVLGDWLMVCSLG
jgi:hypothetical protein